MSFKALFPFQPWHLSYLAKQQFQKFPRMCTRWDMSSSEYKLRPPGFGSVVNSFKHNVSAMTHARGCSDRTSRKDNWDQECG